MRKFADNTGHVWTIEVNVASIKKVRGLLGIDLAGMVTIDAEGKTDISLLKQLGDDPVLLVDTLFVLVSDQAKEASISDVEFGKAMAGDAISEATTALLEETVNFFPRAKRKLLEKVLSLSTVFQKNAEKKLFGMLESEEFEKQIKVELETLSNSPTNSEASAEWIRDRFRSVN